jgi:hypothetical protein
VIQRSPGGEWVELLDEPLSEPPQAGDSLSLKEVGGQLAVPILHSESEIYIYFRQPGGSSPTATFWWLRRAFLRMHGFGPMGRSLMSHVTDSQLAGDDDRSRGGARTRSAPRRSPNALGRRRSSTEETPRREAPPGAVVATCRDAGSKHPLVLVL